MESDRDEKSCVNVLFEDAADIIESLSERLEAAQPKWISVEERLPDEPGEVLICLFGKTCVAWYHKNRCFETGSGLVWWMRSDVTHWMPLPAPLKEES